MAPDSFFVDTGKASKKANLLDDSDSDSDDGGANVSAPKLKINEEYARRFEHNKKREERQRLEEKYKSKKGNDDDESGSGSDSSSESDEDEDGFLVTEDLDAQISATLNALKNKDPRVRNKDFSFFQNEDADADETAPAKKKEKPLRLKDYHREKILAGDVGASDDEQEDKTRQPQTYVQEQAALKKSIISEINKATAAGSDDDNNDENGSGSDDGFVKRKKTRTVADLPDENGVHPSRAAGIDKITETDVVNAEKDPELYLSNFMASRAWKPEGGRTWEAFDSDDDDEHDEQAEAFEQAYNMRFEDPHKSNEVLRSYARDITAAKSVRRDDATGRKRKRQLEKEQKEIEKQERREEKARLKRLKLEEAEQKLRKIKHAAGLSGRELRDEDWVKFLNDAWDDDKWEEEMQKRFGEEYYADLDAPQSDDEDPMRSTKRKPKKPTWDDDIDITDIVPDFEADEGKPDFTLSDEDEDEEDGSRPSKKRKMGKDHKKDRLQAKKAAKAERSKLEALVDAHMDIDEPDVLAASRSRGGNDNGDDEEDGDDDTKTGKQAAAAVRFRYRETSPQAFGLTSRDILFAPTDADLNRFAGLKKLATFRDDEKKRKDKKRLGKKARLREWRRDTFGRKYERTGPGVDPDAAEQAPAAAKDQEVDGAAGAGEAEDGQQKKKRKRSRGKKGKGGGAAVEAE